jgi:superfamily II DNA or RNA helicase
VQWQEQMRDKFGLDFRIVNSTLMGLLRRSRGIHVNPWNHFPRLITSIDFLKRERPLRLFRELLPGPDEPAYPRKFDLLIVDEAHNCAPSGVGRYATDSMRTQALRLPPAATPTITRFAIQHVAQRPAAQARTESLQRQHRADREYHVATRTLTHPLQKIRTV